MKEFQSVRDAMPQIQQEIQGEILTEPTFIPFRELCCECFGCTERFAFAASGIIKAAKKRGWAFSKDTGGIYCSQHRQKHPHKKSSRARKQLELFITARLKGLSLTKIGAQYGFSAQRVQQVLAEAGYGVEIRIPRPLSHD